MNPDEYAAQQAAISALVAQYALQFGTLFSKPALSLAEWVGVLDIIYPQIEYYREQAAKLARTFYDHQRATAHPNLPRNDRFLESYSFDRFLVDMEPARKRMSQADSPDHAIGQVALQAVRAVENAGRQQIIHAVQEDPEKLIVRGWARVATGRETCAWCLMLVSRGPVYLGADTAGLDMDDETAARMIAAGEDVSEYMEEWHAGCDCKVIPVYKRASWHGKAAADRALELWNEATLEAIEIEKDDPGVHTHGKNKGKQFTRNQLALNALRRRLANGEIDPSEFAGIAA
ncbi:hypothetical protein [Mycobacterium avium]|uniref:VG15 protein n=1 Tax=Mycobacterium avium TaxID=1764 RepID=UPI000CE33D5A|nr:hypothetical protein [Mycobacterium avium]